MARSTARRRSSCIATSWSWVRTGCHPACWHSPPGSANLTRLGYVTGFREVADRVWVARQEWFDLNVCLVGGADGLLVVDTQASGRAARAIVDDVRALGIGEVTAVFNTHEHFDHTFGNGAFREAYGAIPIHAHEVAAERTVEAGDRQVELAHPGRGHTAGDAVLRVPDADVVLAGDLVEESGPPAYGVDCHPL